MKQTLDAAPAPKMGQPYRKWDGNGEFDVIVVGSGIGALTTAALLAKRAAKRVLVLERHYTAGGYTHVFKRPRYEWDVGVHYVGEFHRPGSELRAIFDYVGDGGVEWAPVGDVYDRIVIGDEAYDFVTGADRLQSCLKARFPGEERAIDRYFELVESAVGATPHFFMEKALPSAIAWVGGRMLRAPFLRFARRTTTDVLESLTQNRQLIGILTGQWGDYGTPPAQSSFGAHALVTRHYWDGASYPVGGAGRIALVIAPTIENAGGKILINADVKRIVVEGNRAVGVELSDGRVVRAPVVVSGVGVANTFGRLLSPIIGQRLGVPAKLGRVGSSLAHVNLYVGLRQSDEELGLGRANLWIYPGPEHDKNLAAFLANSGATLPVVYISFPSAKDPTFAERYPGRATIQVISFVPYDWFQQWEDKPWKRRGEDYEALKQRFTDRLLDCLYQHVPQVRGKVEHAELSTPLTTRHFANYPGGEPYGLAHTPARFAQRFLRPRTPIRNLFLTGQDVTVCGVAGGLMSGVLCASYMLGRNLLSTIASQRRYKKALVDTRTH